MRITRKAFVDLALWMMALGIVVGVVFPFMTMLLGVPKEIALSTHFIVICLIAGVLLATLNFALVRLVVGKRFSVLASAMSSIKDRFQVSVSGDDTACTANSCFVPVDSEDEMGHCASAFNELTTTLADSREMEKSIYRFSEVVSSILDVEALTGRALGLLLDYSKAQAGAILSEKQGRVVLEAVHGIVDSAKLAKKKYVEEVLKTSKSYTFDIPNDVSIDALLTEFRPRQIILEPLMKHDKPIGVVLLAAGNAFTDEIQMHLKLFTNTLGLCLNNALAHEQLNRIAALDPLTSVYNRRFGLKRLHEEFGRSVRSRVPLTVVMFDIDHFKKVNDTYGHLVGDRVLVSVAESARQTIRDGDLLIRYGGEEFLIVAPAASLKDSELIGERLRRSVEETGIQDGDRTIHVTVSVGTAAFPDLEVKKEEDLIKLADEALYAAKEGGRNRLVIGSLAQKTRAGAAPQS